MNLKEAVTNFWDTLNGRLTKYELSLHLEIALLEADRQNLLTVIAKKVDADFQVFEKNIEGQQPDGPAPTPSDDPSRQ